MIKTIKILVASENAKQIKQYLLDKHRAYEVFIYKRNSDLKSDLAEHKFNLVVCDFNNLVDIPIIKLKKRTIPTILLLEENHKEQISVKLASKFEDILIKDSNFMFITLISLKINKILANIKHKNALRKSEKNFRTIYENSPSAIIISSYEDFKIKRVNKKFCDIFNFKSHDILDKTVDELTYKDDLEVSKKFISKLKSGQVDKYTLIQRFYKSSGKLIWANVTVSAINDELDNPQYLIHVMNDVTSEKTSQFELKKNEEKYRLVIENAISGITIIFNKKIIFSNSSFRELLGFTNNELLNMKFSEIIPITHLPDIWKIFHKFKSNSETFF